MITSQENKTVQSNQTDNRIKIKTESDGIKSQCYLNLNPKAENSFDIFDSYFLRPNDLKGKVVPYFYFDNKEIIKNEIKSLPYSCTLNFSANGEGQIKVCAENIPDSVVCFLTDNQQNKTFVVDSQGINVYVNKGENSDRFTFVIDNKKQVYGRMADKQINITVSPNPVARDLNVYTDNVIGDTEIKIFDVNQKNIKSFTTNKAYNTFDISELSCGIYFVEVINNGRRAFEKFIKY